MNSPIGKKIMIDQLSVLHFLCYWKLLSWLNLSVFSPPYCVVSPHSTRSFTKQDILTSNRLYLLRLFAYHRNPQESFCSSSDLKQKKILIHLVPLMNLTPQWLAVSSGPLSRIHLVWRRSGCSDDAVRPPLCDSHVSVHNLHILSDVERSLYLQNRNGLGWIVVKVRWVWVGSAWFGSVHLLLISLQTTADGTLFGKSLRGGFGCGRSPLCGTVEPERMSGFLEAIESDWGTFNQVERSRPQCSAAGRVEVARRCQISGKTQTYIQGFQLPPAVCVHSAYRRAWH